MFAPSSAVPCPPFPKSQLFKSLIPYPNSMNSKWIYLRSLNPKLKNSKSLLSSNQNPQILAPKSQNPQYKFCKFRSPKSQRGTRYCWAWGKDSFETNRWTMFLETEATIPYCNWSIKLARSIGFGSTSVVNGWQRLGRLSFWVYVKVGYSFKQIHIL